MLEQVLDKVGRLSWTPLLLDEHKLIARACRKTGLNDLGNESFRESFRILLESLENEASLSLLGRFLAQKNILQLLETRLKLVEEWKRHPEIADRPILQPIFVTGLPRSGTTLLHSLLAQDPATRTPLTWEVMLPVPAPEGATSETDPRIAQVDRMLRWFYRLAPEFKAIHPMGARLPQECVAITSYTFRSPQFHASYNVPTYQAWLLQRTQFDYEFHRTFLQYLQWRCPGERWALKAPAHLFEFDALFKTYPDAYIVHTHRDPLKIVASAASLTRVLRSVFSHRVDPVEIGLEVMERWSEGVVCAMKAREGQVHKQDRFVDVRYQEFIRDPIEMVRRIYAQVALNFTVEAETRMRRFLSANPREKHGEHRYTLEEYGLDPRKVKGRFKGYCERFAIEAETDRG